MWTRLSTLAVTLALACLPTGARAQEKEPGAQGEVKGDIGFRPRPHGFNFANWGAGENPHGDLTIDDARCLFGDAVCQRVTGGRCEPTPAARMWLREMNTSMGGGHCEGLAALSAAFHAGARDPRAYGAPTAHELPVSNAELLRMISTLFVTQSLEPVQSVTAQTRQMSTREIVATLQQAMQSKQETYTLGIYGQEGGHAITPYAVEELGGGRYLIHVYDNNYPGVGNVVEVDTGADTWRYAAAALNPAEPAAPWEGTGGAMDLTPLSVRLVPLVCPFCEKQSTSPLCGANAPAAAPAPAPARPPAAAPRTPQRGPTSVQTSANCDQVSVTDRANKRKASFSGGRMVSQIPGAIMTRRRGARGCTVQLPPGAQYDVAVAGRPGQPAQPVDTTIYRPGQVVSLDGASVSPGQEDSIGIGESSFSYHPSADSKPTFAIATDNAVGKDGYYEVTGLELGAGHTFTIDENESGGIVFDTDDPELTSFDVEARLEDEGGGQDYHFPDVDFDDRGEAVLGPGDDGGLMFDMDSDEDGQVDSRDADDDNDGAPDSADTDDDGDGTPDVQEEDADDAADDLESDEPESDEPESDEPESEEPEMDEPESEEPEMEDDAGDEPEDDSPPER